MADSSHRPARPWTPTEKPGDASYNSPVVYVGDHQLGQDHSDVSSDEEDDQGLVQRIAPAGKEFIQGDEGPRPQPLKFRSSQNLREDASASAPEGAAYRSPRLSQYSANTKSEFSQSLRPQRSSQSFVPADDALPANNPYRLSLTTAPRSISAEDVQTSQSTSKSEAPSKDKGNELPSNNPYRPSQPTRSESTDGLIVKLDRPQAPRSESAQTVPVTQSQRLSQTSKGASSESIPGMRSPKKSPSLASRDEDELPSVVGRSERQVKILLINPNSTKSMTDRCLESIADTLPTNVIVYGFTPSRPAPTAIESQTDAIMSTAACAKAILPIAAKYDAFLVACFSKHPLIAALREEVMQPVIGIMEASLYASRMCGSKFGILSTGIRSTYLHETTVKSAYGLGAFSVGPEAAKLGVLELESLPEHVVEERLSTAAKKLQARGADCIALGCAGMTDLQEVCQNAVGMHDRMAMVIDGVAIGVHFLVGLVRENLGTAKGTLYNTISGHKALYAVG